MGSSILTSNTTSEVSAQTSIPVKPTFEEAFPEIQQIVARRKSSWTYLSIMEWQDVSQILLIRIYHKWTTYDPVKADNKLEKWINTLVTNALKNLRRDHLLRLSRPCIGGGKANGKSCEYNRGGDACSYTKSKTQCDECPIYADWQKTRQYQLHIKSTVALENHAQEVNNIQSDFIDIEEIKNWLDESMLRELTRWEARVYRLLFIEHLSASVTSKRLTAVAKRRKIPLKSEDQISYQGVLVYRKRFVEMMKETLKRAGHIG